MIATLSHLIVDAAVSHPQRAAVSSSKDELTYSDLFDRSMRLARALVDHGLEPGDRVVIALPKDVALPVAIFGTLLAGGAYVPIDYLTPSARAHTIAEDAEPVAVISGARTMRAMLVGSADTAHHDRNDIAPALHWLGRGWFDPETPRAREPVSVSLTHVQQLDPLPSPVSVSPTTLAYILYTSGSTGQPKGVAHTHASALAFVQWAVDEASLDETDVLSQHASPSFDLSIFDFFGAAMASARLAFVPESTFGRIPSVCRFIVAAGVTTWYSVPSALLRENAARSLGMLQASVLRQVIFAGEEIPVAPLRALWHSLPPACRVANWYGPTETNVCTFHRITPLDVDSGDPIPIGQPCPYADILIVPHDGSFASNITPGELLVDSETLMAGYWKRPDDTSRVLTTGPDGRVYYATGDLVSRRDAHRLVFSSRTDRLLKVRGHRVQPEEVERVLELRADIEEAVVVKYRRADVDVLAAVICLTGEGALDLDEVTDHCAKFLPSYMAPDLFLTVAELPRGARGKVDYHAALELVESRRDHLTCSCSSAAGGTG